MKNRNVMLSYLLLILVTVCVLMTFAYKLAHPSPVVREMGHRHFEGTLHSGGNR